MRGRKDAARLAGVFVDIAMIAAVLTLIIALAMWVMA